MIPLRIVIIGGGSFNWIPELVRDFITQPELQASTIVLEDIDQEALDLTFRFSKKLIEVQKSSCKVIKTPDLKTALQDADVVLVTITTGGLESMRADIEIPEKYHTYQSVGDTVGPGGLSRALRNIPVMVEIAKTMESICPNAWFLNYTNPMTTLCRAVAKETDIKVAGLCHESLEGLKFLETLFEVPPERIETKLAGINHLVWLLDVKVDGKDANIQLRELLQERAKNPAASFDGNFHTPLLDRGLVKSKLFSIFNSMPMAGDRHAAEFFPFFLSEHAIKENCYGVELTSIEDRYQWRTDAEKYINKLMTDENEARSFLKGNSGEAAPKICVALASDTPYVGLLNLPNRGQISNLPDDIIVETKCVIDRNNAYGCPMGDLPDPILNIVLHHVINQEMIVEAALSGDWQKTLQALANDPLVVDLDNVEPMFEEMLIANRQYLSRYFSSDTRE